MRRQLGGRAARAALIGIAALAAAIGIAVGAPDFGQQQQTSLFAHSQQQFGISSPLAASSSTALDAATALADPLALATLAKPLRARVVTSGVAAPNLDMMGLWPAGSRATHIIACNEQGASAPGLQRIDLATGAAETILTGTVSCDPVHVTTWGTIVFGEEAGGGVSGGRIYELIDPLGTTSVTLDRATGTFSGGTGAEHFAVRSALGRLSFEGIALYPNGVTYYGDEQRPSNGTPGGAYFKFIPNSPWSGGTVTALSQSPLAEGTVFGLRLGARSGGTDYGQATEVGLGTWVALTTVADDDPDLRALAVDQHLTGYYRPEDIAIDGSALAAGGRVRFCGNNTGNENEDQYYGETICVTDGMLAEATANTARPELQRLVLGNPQYAMPDNIAYQPLRGNWIVMEDAETDYPGPLPDTTTSGPACRTAPIRTSRAMAASAWRP